LPALVKAAVLEASCVDEVSRKMLERVNCTAVSKSDILQFVKELAKREAGDSDFEGRAILLARFHSGNPDKAIAIEFRMEALARLLGGTEPKAWTLPPLPDGAVPTSEPVFAAAAVQPLIEVGGRPGFERSAFFAKVLELASVGGNA
jgi:hypothetical protein